MSKEQNGASSLHASSATPNASSVTLNVNDQIPTTLDPKKCIIKVKKVKPLIGIFPNQISTNQQIKSTEINLDDKYTRDEVANVINEATEVLESATFSLSQAREIATPYGLMVDSSILNTAYQTPLIPSNKVSASQTTNNDFYINQLNNNYSNATSYNSSSRSKLLPNVPQVLSTTGGHSNTDHLVLNTGHIQLDHIAELKRNLKRRARAMQPECKGEDRWDQPRVPGQGIRRRRITREVDLPQAPPEPPMSGYVLFVAQMTAKIKHDTQQKSRSKGRHHSADEIGTKDEPQHDQIKVVREISKIWRFGLKTEEKQYYMDFAVSAKLEYHHQIREFRATGGYTPSSTFMKLGEGPWVRKIWHEKSELERELATYPMDIFKLKHDKRSNPKNINSNKNSEGVHIYDFVSHGFSQEESIIDASSSKIQSKKQNERKEGDDTETDGEFFPGDED